MEKRSAGRLGTPALQKAVRLLLQAFGGKWLEVQGWWPWEDPHFGDAQQRLI